MADTDENPAALLDDLAALDPSQRSEVAKELRTVAETFLDPACGCARRHRIGHRVRRDD